MLLCFYAESNASIKRQGQNVSAPQMTQATTCGCPQDCAGVPFGVSYTDTCGVCDDDPSNDNACCDPDDPDWVAPDHFLDYYGVTDCASLAAHGVEPYGYYDKNYICDSMAEGGALNSCPTTCGC